jgi:hypothetical protein
VAIEAKRHHAHDARAATRLLVQRLKLLVGADLFTATSQSFYSPRTEPSLSAEPLLRGSHQLGQAAALLKPARLAETGEDQRRLSAASATQSHQLMRRGPNACDARASPSVIPA